MKTQSRIFGIVAIIILSASFISWAKAPEYVQGWDTTEPTAEKSSKATKPKSQGAVLEDIPQQIVQDFEWSTVPSTSGFSIILGLAAEDGFDKDAIVWKEIDLSVFGMTSLTLAKDEFIFYEIQTDIPRDKKPISANLPWQFIPWQQNESKGILLWLAPKPAGAGQTRYFCFEHAKTSVHPPKSLLEWQSDLKTSRIDGRLLVSNKHYELEFDLGKNGILSSMKFQGSGKTVGIKSADELDGEKTRIPDPVFPISLRKGIISSSGKDLGFLFEVPGRIVSAAAGNVRFVHKYLFVADSPLIAVRSELPEQSVRGFVNNVLLQTYQFAPNKFELIRRFSTKELFEHEISEPFSILRSEKDAFCLYSPRLSGLIEKPNSMSIGGLLLRGRADGRAQPWSGQIIRCDSLLYVGSFDTAFTQIEKASKRKDKIFFADLAPKSDSISDETEKKLQVLRRSSSEQDKARICMADMLVRFAQDQFKQTANRKQAKEYINTVDQMMGSNEPVKMPIVVQRQSFIAIANSQSGYLFVIKDGVVCLDAVWHPAGSKFIAQSAGFESTPIWRLRMAKGQKENKYYTEWDGSDVPVSAPKIDQTVSGQAKLIFNWAAKTQTKISTAVQAIFVLNADKPFLQAFLETEAMPAETYLWEVDFPVVGGIGYPIASNNNSHLVTPYKSGLRIDSPGRRLFDRDGMLYPGAAGWQFLSYYDDDRSALYFAAHDSQGYMKRFRHDPKGNALTLCYTHQPEGKGISGAAFKQPYPCLFGPHTGDWYDATQFYREFLLTTEWFPKKTLAQNDRLPKWLKEYPLCIRIFTGNEDQQIPTFVRKNIELIEKLQSPATLIQWYGWNNAKPHMAGRPEQYPDPEFLACLPEFKKHSAVIMPYTCALLWDVRNEAYKKLGGEKSAMRDLNGDVVMARYGNQPLAMVSPSHPIYQDYMVTTLGNTLNSIDVQGIYFDMWGTSSGGHYRAADEPWGGNGRTIGMRQLGKKVKAVGLAKNPQFFMAMEGNADCYFDIVDSYILFTGNLPIRQSLYGDYVRPFGDKTSEWLPEPYELWFPARHFAWGAPIGRIFEFQLCSKEGVLDPAKVAYYKNLTAYRTVSVPWLCYGRMLRPLKLHTVLPQEPDCVLESETIPNAVWQAPDGSIAFVFANGRHSVKETTFAYDMNLSDYGIPSDGSWSIYRLTPKQTGNGYEPNFETIEKITGQTLSRTERISGADVLILVARPTLSGSK